MMRTVHYRFDEVSLSTRRAGKCSGCGKRTTRTIRVYQTVNPFNKNAKGIPKSREEILDEVRRELGEQKAKPLLCTACE